MIHPTPKIYYLFLVLLCKLGVHKWRYSQARNERICVRLGCDCYETTVRVIHRKTGITKKIKVRFN